MHNSLLLEAYRSLDAAELAAFAQFVASPYYNQSEIIIALNDHLSGFYPAFSGNLLEKGAVYEAIFPGEAHDDGKLRVFMSRLLRLLEKFLAVREMEREPMGRISQVLKALRNREAPRWIRRTVKQARAEMQAPQPRDSEYHLRQYVVGQEIEGFEMRDSAARRDFRDLDLTQSVKQLDAFYLVNKLRYFCTFKNFERILSYEPDYFLLDEIQANLSPRMLETLPAVAVYAQVLKTLTESDEDRHFFDLKNLLEAHHETLGTEMAREAYIYAQNYCIRRVNAGETGFLRELFDLYRAGLRSGLILDKGVLSPWTYKNVTAIGLRLGELDWVGQFLTEYVRKLPEEDRENAFTYNRAKYYFYLGDYSRVISLLMKVEYNNVFYGLDSRALLLKTYFEMEETEALDSLVDSFRIFLRRKKIISAHHRKGYLNHIKFVRKLSRLAPGKTKRLAEIETEIGQTKPVMDVGWLYEKVREMKG